jgi:hypothetical protein
MLGHYPDDRTELYVYFVEFERRWVRSTIQLSCTDGNSLRLIVVINRWTAIALGSYALKSKPVIY